MVKCGPLEMAMYWKQIPCLALRTWPLQNNMLRALDPYQRVISSAISRYLEGISAPAIATFGCVASLMFLEALASPLARLPPGEPRARVSYSTEYGVLPYLPTGY